MEQIRVELTKQPMPKPDISKTAFGTVFSDHMFVMDYAPDKGWYDPRIIPFAPITLSPASTVFHYGVEIFEGMKAYRRADGGIQLFRPDQNITRFNSSADRMCMPLVDEAFLLSAIKQLVSLDRDWVPSEPDSSLYIRPFMFATEPVISVHAHGACKLMIITSPVACYYPTGLNPTKILIETEDVRAVKGGTGYVKCGGNYAASNRAGAKAEAIGYSQVLWLDGVERKYIEEVGSMNVMFKINGKVVTPRLTGSVLPGITRKSCLELMRHYNIPVEERLISVDELIEACRTGALEEAWGTGTAAVVSPIGELCYKGEKFTVNGGKIGAFTQQLYDKLTGIQWGKCADPFGWTVRID